MAHEILHARRDLSRLKRGVPPSNVACIAVGMDRLISRSRDLLHDDPSARWFAVAGEYGEGKSFFQALLSEIARESGYAVATMDVNKDVGALNQPQRHLGILLGSLQSPLPRFRCYEGLDEILRQWFDAAARAEITSVLLRMEAVTAWSRPGLDGDLLSDMILQLVRPERRSDPANGPPSFQGDQDAVVLLGPDGVLYGRGAMSGAVLRRPQGNSQWERFRHLRVVFAATPEVMDMLDHGGRASYLEDLEGQVTVRPEEVQAYRR
jgi:hypothetical protein